MVEVVDYAAVLAMCDFPTIWQHLSAPDVDCAFHSFSTSLQCLNTSLLFETQHQTSNRELPEDLKAANLALRPGSFANFSLIGPTRVRAKSQPTDASRADFLLIPKTSKLCWPK